MTHDAMLDGWLGAAVWTPHAPCAHVTANSTGKRVLPPHKARALMADPMCMPLAVCMVRASTLVSPPRVGDRAFRPFTARPVHPLDRGTLRVSVQERVFEPSTHRQPRRRYPT
jgi:hypothetical protein